MTRTKVTGEHKPSKEQIMKAVVNYAYDRLREAAEMGNDFAQYYLGFSHFYGIFSAEKNFAEGMKWLERAYKQGNLLARYTLNSGYYLSGNEEGMKKICEETKEEYLYFKKALDKFYSEREDVEPVESIPKHKDDANKETIQMADAIKNNGTYKNKVYDRYEEEAFEILQDAAENGDERVQLYLGMCYSYGLGLVNKVDKDKDGKKAEKWLWKAAKQGNKDARRELEILYESLNDEEALSRLSWYFSER